MNRNTLTTISNYDCFVTNLIAFRIESIKLQTTRSKGQYTTHRLFYITGGSCKFVLNDNSVIHAATHDILYFPPDVLYSCVWDSNPDNGAMTLQFRLECGGKELFLADDVTLLLRDKYGVYQSLFQTMVSVFGDGKSGYKIKCQSLFLELLYSLIPDLIKHPPGGKHSSVYKGILYIENNYLSEIDVNKVAEICSLCPSAFRQKFHAVCGMSPIQYKNYLKMKKAAELLQTGDFTVSEVAEQLGFEDIYYFNKMFKKYYRLSPGKFRISSRTESEGV